MSFPPPQQGGAAYNSFPRMGGMPFRPPGNFATAQMPGAAQNMMHGVPSGRAPPPGMPGMPRLGGPPMAGGFPGRPGFPGASGPAGGRAPPPLLPENPIGPRPASTVYVGKIASSVPDPVIKEMLEACGSIKSWTPVKEPSGTSKGFGFCEYEDADGALRALRLLHNLSLDGQELLLKPNTATQKYLVWFEQQKEARRRRQQHEADEHKARKQAEAEAKAAAQENGDAAAEDVDVADKDKPEEEPEPVDEAAQEQATDDLALTIIMGIVSSRPAQPTADDAAAASDKKDDRRGSHRDDGHARLSSPRSSKHADRARDDEADREAALAAEFERDRQRQRAMQEDMRRREERELQRRLDGWERHERNRDKDRERERDRLRDMERERARYVKADLEAHESDDEREPWQRRSLRHLRRMDERRKRRQRELEEDAADRAKEAAELAEAAAKAAAEGGSSPVPANGTADVEAEPGSPAAEAFPALPADEGVVKAEAVGKEEEQPHLKQEDDAIFQAMQAAAFGAAPSPQQQQQQPSPQQAVAQPSPQQQQQQAPLGRTAVAGKRGNRAAVSALFGDDEEDTSKKRKLVPIRYSEDEIKAVQDHTQALSEAAAQAAAGQQQQEPPQPQPVQDAHHPAYPPGLDLSGCKAFLRQWMDTLPNTKEPLYAFPVRWEFMAEGSLNNIGAWVAKKVPELVGMEEPDLVEFIMGHVRNHAPAGAMEDELNPVLMQDTVGFVMKLKRLVIYECERSGLQKRFAS